MTLRLIASLSILLCAAACGPAPEVAAPIAETDDAIVHGHTDTADIGVAAMFVDLGNGSGYLCSGEIIGPHTFLTAGHCARPFTPGLAGVILRETNINISANPDAGNIAFPIDFAEANPKFVEGGSGDWNDIGIVHTAADGGDMPPPYLSLNRYPLDRLVVLAKPVTEVGYGITSDDGGGAGLRREVTKYDMQVRSPGELTSGAQTGLTCEGDSGGPALYLTPDGVMSVIGVTSRGDESCQVNGIDTRVDAYLDFINRFMEDAGDAPDCGADGRCGFNCTAPDPDCPCAPDGFCTAACATPQADPDCPESCLYDGGSCVPVVPTSTPDAGLPAAPGGGCGSAGGGTALLGLLALVLRRRRSAP